MMSPLKINGAGNPISAAVGMYVTIKTKSTNELGVRLFMHPLQKVQVLSIPNTIILSETVEAPDKFCGLEIVEDPNMKDDEIHWRDKDNVLVAKVTGLKT